MQQALGSEEARLILACWHGVGFVFPSLPHPPSPTHLPTGYTLYSSSTVLVLTIGSGVWGFTFDQLVGEFILTHPDIKIPETGKIYSFNEGNYNVRAVAAWFTLSTLNFACGRQMGQVGVAGDRRRTRTPSPCSSWRAGLDGGAARLCGQPEGRRQLEWQALLLPLHRLPGRRLPPHTALR